MMTVDQASVANRAVENLEFGAIGDPGGFATHFSDLSRQAGFSKDRIIHGRDVPADPSC
jgi:hypothetical protein